MKALQDSGMQTENENAAGGGTGGGAGHNALSVFTPVTLRDVFLEQQREVRFASTFTFAGLLEEKLTTLL